MEPVHLTVSELIDKLLEIEDKSQKVYTDGEPAAGIEVLGNYINVYSDV